MLRTAAKRLLSGSRGFMTSAARLEEAPASTVKEFKETWTKLAPSTMVAPEVPSNFVSSSATGESLTQGDLFPVNFYTPHGVIAGNVKKDTVVLPGINGVFGLKANHVATIAQLKPGVVELHSGTDVDKYFVSGGFAFVHPNGVTDICVLEAATLDQIDAAAVKSALASASSAQAADDYDAAVNRTAVELYSALDSALDNKA